MATLDFKKKRLLTLSAAVIVLALIGASIYKPPTYEEYLAKKQGKIVEKTKKQQQRNLSAPQIALEDFLNYSVTDPNKAVKYLESNNQDISSVDQVIKFLDIKIPLYFNYDVKDITSNETTAKILVDLVTPSGNLEREIELKNIDGEWKLTNSKSGNDNLLLVPISKDKLYISIPQNMYIERSTSVMGENLTIKNEGSSTQIIILATNKDVSSNFSEMINCTRGTCKKKNIGDIQFDTFEMANKASSEYIYTMSGQKDGIYFMFMSMANTETGFEELKVILDSVKI